jgi:hypothetical protein
LGKHKDRFSLKTLNNSVHPEALSKGIPCKNKDNDGLSPNDWAL